MDSRLSRFQTASVRRLGQTPRLLVGYLAWVNGKHGASVRWYVVVLAILGVVTTSLFWEQREMVAAGVKWLQRHIGLFTGLAALTSAVTVARRRVRKGIEARRSWLAALPVRPTAARWEAVAIEVAPVGALLIGLAVVFGPTSVVFAFARGQSWIAVLTAWLGLILGAGLGVVVSYAIPTRKQIASAPGSRYVPHKQGVSAAAPRPSLAPLGIWPIRQMFAGAQPKAMARAALPILLCIPGGSSAGAALVIVATFAFIGMLLLLVSSVISVSAIGRDWLAPLPLTGNRTARALLTPSLAVIAVLNAITASLLWIGGFSARLAAELGLFAAIASSLVAVGGSFMVLARASDRS
jgi:hypothetical protein